MRELSGAMSITETGTESFPIIEILIPLGLEELAVNFTDLFLEASKFLRVGENIMPKESLRGRMCKGLEASGAIKRVKVSDCRCYDYII